MHLNYLENTPRRLGVGWPAIAELQEWLDGRIPPVRADAESHEQDPRETPSDDPRRKTDWPNTKQTDEPWKGNPEKEQLDPNRPKPDLEEWQETNTH